ncbi:iron ABC transporter permease [Hoyosella sp. G463]|uniref:Iron ABC transporter permease n=1 Tax=Lolliginicoccus lacisalsi TaxID=2742202 RepID=A0A927JD40_9ACTN|nr:iron ABC transporter permease [Lolliginicoccus lacisalsi]MBD8507129.1 iron ABC transporter permease [Lolliginicoccus lacisalsi]
MAIQGAAITGQRPAAPRTVAPQRHAMVLSLAAGLLVLVSVVSLLVGPHPLSPQQVAGALLDYQGTTVDRIVAHIRLPRLVTGLLAGLALGGAGAIMQGLTRNPLAGPGVLGINAGAALGAVIAIGVLGISSVTGYIWFALAGAALVATLVYLLGAMGRGGATPFALVLTGAAVSALAASITSAISLLDRSAFQDFRFWVVGSLTRADLDSAVAILPFILAGAVLALTAGRTLDAVALGDDMARSLGTRLARARILCAVAVVLLAGSATAIAGPIAFVGLVVPHLARALVGTGYRAVTALSMLLAPIVLIAADAGGRLLVAPQELQVGIVTGLLGAPFFLVLVGRRRMAAL